MKTISIQIFFGIMDMYTGLLNRYFISMWWELAYFCGMNKEIQIVKNLAAKQY